MEWALEPLTEVRGVQACLMTSRDVIRPWFHLSYLSFAIEPVSSAEHAALTMLTKHKLASLCVTRGQMRNMSSFFAVTSDGALAWLMLLSTI